MADSYQIKEIAERIREIKEGATELKYLYGGIQAIDRNADRILASVKMLEINISDISDIA